MYAQNYNTYGLSSSNFILLIFAYMNRQCYSKNRKYSLVLDSFIPHKTIEHVGFHLISGYNQAVKKFQEQV